jgi:hypothetical protein
MEMDGTMSDLLSELVIMERRSTASLSADNSDARTLCSEILSGLTIVERLALKAISNDERHAASVRLLGRFKVLGLIEHDGQRLILTESGWLVLRLCNHGAVAR